MHASSMEFHKQMYVSLKFTSISDYNTIDNLLNKRNIRISWSYILVVLFQVIITKTTMAK
jgi:hypothetical protein